MKYRMFIICQWLFFSHLIYAQPPANYDEAKVGEYTLPPLLITDNGKKITTSQEWESVQRPAILKKFRDHVYGRMPGPSKGIHVKILSEDKLALNGKATRKEVIIYFTREENGPHTVVLLYIPNNQGKPVPAALGLNFQGNHTTQKDPGITVTDNWKRIRGVKDSVIRGSQDRRWPVEEIIDRGYAMVTAYYEDFEPDHRNGWKTGIRTALKYNLGVRPQDWGAIGAWAWGLSRIMDYLETEKSIDAGAVMLTGHSRLGKAALWAGANDQRFFKVVSNNSGEGGAALSRRNFGETAERINTAFPHWFIDKYKSYNRKVNKLPVDQHMLLALIAPRQLYVASAVDDTWADPKGEFLSALAAGEVYSLYGKNGLGVTEMPGLNQPVGETVRYHIRTGGHDMLLYDWQQYLK